MSRKPDWTLEGRDWPNRETSRFVEAGGLRWHVQTMGAGPVVLLLHGTGSATHSWRDLAPMLAHRFTIAAPELPGHGFTATPQRPADLSLPSVAQAVGALMRTLGLVPQAIVGHSAGAAIAVRMTLDGLASPRVIVSLNGALLPFPGALGRWAPSLAQIMFANPISLAMFAHRAAQPGAVASLMRRTGSRLDAAGLDFYERLFRTRGHLEATIGLMAHWDLATLARDLPQLRTPLILATAQNDSAVPVSAARTVAALVPGAEVLVVPKLGHLAHEERPAEIAELIVAALQKSAVAM